MTQLATTGYQSQTMARLDPYVGGLSDEAPRVDALAVISCGTRGEGTAGRPGLPRASKPGDTQQIHLHDPQGHAPGIAAALEERGHKNLLISFPLDDPRQFVIQRFTRYSASRLEVYGDESGLTVIEATGEHRLVPTGTPEFDKLVRTCKADTRIYFCLAEWDDAGAEVVFPDGLGVYAIRTTSRHSVRSILGSLQYTQQFTRGKIAGLPFLLEVAYREVAGPDGAKRTIPVWTITTKPPQNARLTSRTFRELATNALREGELLMLPAPTALALADFAAAGPADVDEPTDEQMTILAAGGLCDADRARRAWHALARGTVYESDAARSAFLTTYTNGRFDSLATFLRQASEGAVEALLAGLQDAITESQAPKDAARYAEIFGTEDGLATDTDRGAPAEPMVMDYTHHMVAAYAKLTSAAERLGIGYTTLTLPIAESKLDVMGHELKERIVDERKARAAVAA